MTKYSALREREHSAASLAPILAVILMLTAFPVAAEGVDAPAPGPAANGVVTEIPKGEPLCQLLALARTALQTANHGMALMEELKKSIDDRLTESKSAFKSCEQDESCRTSSRLRDLEEAFNQAHGQKQRMSSAHDEAVQRKAELEARFSSLKKLAVEAGCQGLEAPATAR